MSKAVLLALSLIANPAWADWQLNMNEGVTALSREIFDLHMLIFWICVGIGVVVFGVMFYSIFKHRKSKGAVAEHWHENTTVEVIWTVVPFVILIGMAVPATATLIDMYDTSEADVDIQITGYQCSVFVMAGIVSITGFLLMVYGLARLVLTILE